MVELPITNLDTNDHRPIVVNHAYEGMRLLFDTGATLPVWTAGESDLFDYFPNAVKTRYLCLLGGFGGAGSVVPVYKIPEFTIMDAAGEFVDFLYVYMALSNMDRRFDCILSYNLFRPLDLHFDGINGSYIRIDYPKGKYKYLAQPKFRRLNGVGLKDGEYLEQQEVLLQQDFAEKTNFPWQP